MTVATVHRPKILSIAARLRADTRLTGRGVTIAFIDSGFYPHPDLTRPANRIRTFVDVLHPHASAADFARPRVISWHGMMTSVCAAGNGYLSRGLYKGLAPDAHVVLIKVADERGHVSEHNILRGLQWVLAHLYEYSINVVNISVGGDREVPHEASRINRTVEEIIGRGVVVVVAAGNTGTRRIVPPASTPAVITVGGLDDKNSLRRADHALYWSSFGPTVDGVAKPEIIAPAIWVAAPILPGTSAYQRAEAFSQIIAAPDYLLPNLVRELWRQAEISEALVQASPEQIRAAVESILRESKIVATHYQHVDGTSFAAPIVASVVAQMLEANPYLTPVTIKQILIATADRIPGAPLVRQGYGVLNARRAVDHASREMHALEHAHFQPPRVEMGRLIFFYHNDHAERVALAGDFNSWNANHTRFVKTPEGLWRVEIDSPLPGRYHYKFVIDGDRWVDDPSNGLKMPDIYGGFNSVLNVR